MYKVIIWGDRGTYSSLVAFCRFLSDTVQVLGIAVMEKISGYLDDYPVINPAEIRTLTYDYILLPSCQNYSSLAMGIMKITGCGQEKIVSQDVMMLPGFSFEKYKKLRESKPTILTRNCMGGYLYHHFRMSFLSPTINMFFPEEDFLSFAGNLKHYMQAELQVVDALVNKNWTQN